MILLAFLRRTSVIWFITDLVHLDDWFTVSVVADFLSFPVRFPQAARAAPRAMTLADANAYFPIFHKKKISLYVTFFRLLWVENPAGFSLEWCYSFTITDGQAFYKVALEEWIENGDYNCWQNYSVAIRPVSRGIVRPANWLIPWDVFSDVIHIVLDLHQDGIAMGKGCHFLI